MRLRHHFSFVELFVYISILGLISNISLVTYSKYIELNNYTEQISNQIMCTVNVGELWRRDIAESNEKSTYNENIFLIKRKNELISYKVESSTLFRKTHQIKKWYPVLHNIKYIQFSNRSKTYAEIWDLDIELKQIKEKVHTKPLFTFIGVRKI